MGGEGRGKLQLSFSIKVLGCFLWEMSQLLETAGKKNTVDQETGNLSCTECKFLLLLKIILVFCYWTTCCLLQGKKNLNIAFLWTIHGYGQLYAKELNKSLKLYCISLFFCFLLSRTNVCWSLTKWTKTVNAKSGSVNYHLVLADT